MTNVSLCYRPRAAALPLVSSNVLSLLEQVDIKTWRAWQPRRQGRWGWRHAKSGPTLADALRVGELSGQAKPTAGHINYLVAPRADVSYIGGTETGR